MNRTEDLLRELAHDLPPVRRLPPLRVAGAGVLAAWLAGAVSYTSLFGVSRVSESGGVGDPVYLLILVGLALAAAGGLPAALARAVPGREPTARAGAFVLAAGLLLAAGGGLTGVAQAGGLTGGGGLACLGRAALLALAPGLVTCAFLARAWQRRPGPAALAVALASLALGAVAVHASCVAEGGAHRLVGHVLGPLLTAGLLALPLARWLGRRVAC